MHLGKDAVVDGNKLVPIQYLDKQYLSFLILKPSLPEKPMEVSGQF